MWRRIWRQNFLIFLYTNSSNPWILFKPEHHIFIHIYICSSREWKVTLASACTLLETPKPECSPWTRHWSKLKSFTHDTRWIINHGCPSGASGERPFIENRDGVHASNVKSKTGTAEIRAVPPLPENLCRPKRRNTSGTAFLHVQSVVISFHNWQAIGSSIYLVKRSRDRNPPGRPRWCIRRNRCLLLQSF